MALNFSHRPIFPPHLSEENLVSPMCISSGYLVDGVSERNSDAYGMPMPWFINQDVEDCLDFRDDVCDRGVLQECGSRDILDLLPPDPFGMDISTTFTAITGWLEDLEVDYGGYGIDESVPVDGNYQFFAGLNILWNNAIMFQTFPGGNTQQILPNSVVMGGFGFSCEERKTGDVTCCNGCNDFELPCMVDTIQSLGMENPETSGVLLPDDLIGAAADEGLPHEALSFVLDYLGLRDLLVVETVCKSLRSTIQGDPFFFRSIHIDEPLNDKITDDALLQLTNKAQGNLQCLSLVKCAKITDDALKEVLLNNPKLTKLCVPGCTRLSIEGITSNLRAFRSIGTPGIKHLSIGGLYGVTQNHFEELKFLLGADNLMPQDTPKPQFYHGRSSFPLCNGGRAIDIETCPKCQNLRLVYDCPVAGCKGKEDDGTQTCRACTLCIARCVQCGQCINDNEYEETFCLELLCLDCWKQLSICQVGEGEVGSSILAEESCSFSLPD